MKCEGFVPDPRCAICAFSAFFLLAGATAGLAQTPVSPADKSATKGTAPATPVQSSPPATKGSPMPVVPGDMLGPMMAMMKNMQSMQMSGNTDRDFAMMMKMHHEGAIDMAQQELLSGKDPKMRATAKRIIEAQKKEIKEFERWLGAHK